MADTDPAATLRRAAELAPKVLPAAIAELVAGEIRFRDSEVLAAEVLALARQQSSSDTCMAFVPDGPESAAPCDRPTVPGTGQCDRHQCNGDWACPAEVHAVDCMVLPPDLLYASIRFWQCPIVEHRGRTDGKGGPEGSGRDATGQASREDDAGKTVGRGLTCTPSGVAAPMPADVPATPAPLSSRSAFGPPASALRGLADLCDAGAIDNFTLTRELTPDVYGGGWLSEYRVVSSAHVVTRVEIHHRPEGAAGAVLSDIEQRAIATPVRVYRSETTFAVYRTPGADALFEVFNADASEWQPTRWESLEALVGKCGPMTEVTGPWTS